MTEAMFPGPWKLGTALERSSSTAIPGLHGKTESLGFGAFELRGCLGFVCRLPANAGRVRCLTVVFEVILAWVGVLFGVGLGFALWV